MKLLRYLLRLSAAFSLRCLSSWTYSFQTYSVLQVLTAAQMNQEEVNIRDHLHGAAGVAALGHTFTSPALTRQILTDAGSLAWDANLGSVAKLTMTNTARFIAPLSNMVVGHFVLELFQGTTAASLTWDPTFKWDAGVAPLLSTTSGAGDYLSFYCNSQQMIGGLFVRGAA